MDDKARIAELEGMVAGLRDFVKNLWPDVSPDAPIWDNTRAWLEDTKAVAEAHDARIERRGEAKGLREAAKLADEKRLKYQKKAQAIPGFESDALRTSAEGMYRLKEDFEARAEELEKDG